MSMLKKIAIVSVTLVVLIILISLTNFTWMQSVRTVILSFIYLFLPGYAISLFVFKEADLIERITYSVALSMVILPLPASYASLYEINIPKSIFTTIIILGTIAALIFRHGWPVFQKDKKT